MKVDRQRRMASFDNRRKTKTELNPRIPPAKQKKYAQTDDRDFIADSGKSNDYGAMPVMQHIDGDVELDDYMQSVVGNWTN